MCSSMIHIEGPELTISEILMKIDAFGSGGGFSLGGGEGGGEFSRPLYQSL